MFASVSELVDFYSVRVVVVVVRFCVGAWCSTHVIKIGFCAFVSSGRSLDIELVLLLLIHFAGNCGRSLYGSMVGTLDLRFVSDVRLRVRRDCLIQHLPLLLQSPVLLNSIPC